MCDPDPIVFRVVLNSSNRQSGGDHSECGFTVPDLSRIGPCSKILLQVERFHVVAQEATRSVATTSVTQYSYPATEASDGTIAPGALNGVTTYNHPYYLETQVDTLETVTLSVDLPQKHSYDALRKGPTRVIAANGSPNNLQGSYTTSAIPLRPIELAIAQFTDAPMTFTLHQLASTSGTTTAYTALNREWTGMLTFMCYPK